MNIVIWIITGIIAGWLTGMLVKGGGFGLLGDLVVGVLGGVIGGWLFGLLGISVTNWLGQVLVAAAGGIVLVLVVRQFRRV
jgi:uncharacterized membrane protein YeaQ/YmgE (transglycosylase-associated protein family)